MSTKLSSLWLFATLNYLYADVVGLMNPNLLKQYVTGVVNGIHFTEGFLFGASALVEIPIAMVLLSRILKYKVNRYANIIAGVIMTLVQFSSLFAGRPASYYIFFSILEIAATLAIIWYAWRWSKEESI